MFVIFKAREAFTKLRQVFIEASILNHFNLEYYIQIETNIFDYTIDKILNQWTLDNLSQ